MKSDRQPFCPCCNDKLPKSGRPVDVMPATYRPNETAASMLATGYAAGPLRDLQQCQDFVRRAESSERVTSIRRDKRAPDFVMSFQLWDGLSYTAFHGHFCSQSCAGLFARRAYEATLKVKA